MILYDDSGWLAHVQLTRDEAIQFFHGRTPEELLQNRDSYKWIRQQLNRLCPHKARDTERPLLEACIRSFTTTTPGNGTTYQIFDTVLAVPEESQ